MILNKEQILAILNRQPKKLKNKFNGKIINEYSYTLEEQLNLIQTYIYFVKGIDVGDIKPPSGNMCASFINLAVSKGIHPINAMEKGNDLEAANFAMEISLKYFKNKYDESN